MNIVDRWNSAITFLTSDWTIKTSISILPKYLTGIDYLSTSLILNSKMNSIRLQVNMYHMLMESNRKMNQPTHPNCLTHISTWKLASPGDWIDNYVMPRLIVVQLIDMGYQLELKTLNQPMI